MTPRPPAGTPRPAGGMPRMEPLGTAGFTKLAAKMNEVGKQAKAAGLHAIDNVYLRLMRKDDPPARVAEIERGLREKNMGAAALGMDGTTNPHVPS